MGTKKGRPLKVIGGINVIELSKKAKCSYPTAKHYLYRKFPDAMSLTYTHAETLKRLDSAFSDMATVDK